MIAPILAAENIGKKFYFDSGNKTLEVLKGINLKAQPGDTIAITGPSGSGKSTLLNCLGTLDRPTSGQVKINGNIVNNMSDNALSAIRCREIGFVFQLHHLLPQLTVRENILLPALAHPESTISEATHRHAEILLERTGMTARADFLPENLSGGERLRAALARAFINNPKLILADEPTGALDRKHADDMVSLMLEINRTENTTLIMVTHSGKVANMMSQQFILIDGRLEAI